MKLPVPTRWDATLMWPAGVALTTWIYVWRTTPIHRREQPGERVRDLPPHFPPSADSENVQWPHDGSGPLFHRLYTGRVSEARWKAAEVMERIKDDPNIVAPLALARFRKVRGGERAMSVGDEFIVRMPGPWDGPVRAIEVTSNSFRFATLSGHLEAGQIEWRARDEDGVLVFQIESWARSGDRLSAILHDRLRMAKEVQLHMWTSVVEKVAGRAHGRLLHGIEIETRRLEPDQVADTA